MEQEIIYGGLSANMSDYNCNDGELAASLNLINEDGQLRPIFQPKQLTSLEDGTNVLCIHKTATFEHYITIDNLNRIRYFDSDNPAVSHAVGILEASAIYNTTTIGNTVCILTNKGVFHYLWSSQSFNGNYTKLPESMPETKLSFGLQCEFYASDAFNVKCAHDSYNNTSMTITDKEQIERVNDQVLGAVNKFISEELNDKGKFLMPFFVRYAYRLYDDSLTRHSAPILMVPDSKGVPTIWAKTISYSGTDTIFNTQLFSPTFELDYAMVPNNATNGLSLWSDIIRSIDVFVSAPLYSYDQNGDVTSLSSIASNQSWGIYSMKGTMIDRLCDPSVATKLKSYGYHDLWNAARSSGVIPANATSYIKFDLPTKSEGQIKENLSNCANFYLLKSIPIAELKTQRTVIECDKGYLSSLVNHEVMTDDYDSHDSIIAQNAYVYNNRLILSDISKEVFAGYLEQPFVNGRLHQYDIATKTDTATNTRRFYCRNVVDYAASCFKVTEMYTHFRRDGKVSVVHHAPASVDGGALVNYVMTPVSMSHRTGNEFYIPFFYHPDSHATKVELIGTYNGSTYKLTLPLKQHEMLNGSFYFDDFNVQSLLTNSYSAATTDNRYDCQNKLYVSEVNNPFFFPAQGIVSVGTGKVIGLSTAAQALSQGQFGSFPLYAFTTDGLWALTVSNTGSFSAVQPITRDVCVSANSITQLDDSVLFATTRGIMIVAGANVRCLSDVINSDQPFDVSSLQGVATLENMLHLPKFGCTSVCPLKDFVTGCRMVYDYLHQRVIVYNTTTDEDGERIYNYAYVLSLKSLAWGMMFSDIAYSLNSYPEAIAVDDGGNVVSFSDTDELECHGLFVTRPIKFGKAGIFKSVHEVLQRGYFQNGNGHNDVCTVLYGSRDLFNWFVIGTSVGANLRRMHGSPYKYFRIAGVTVFSKDKSLSGATFDVIPRSMNNLH